MESPKIYLFSKKVEIEFWVVTKSWYQNIQVGLNMHLYEDIGDASSSLRGSNLVSK